MNVVNVRKIPIRRIMIPDFSEVAILYKFSKIS